MVPPDFGDLVNLVTENTRADCSTSTMQTPKEWDIESVLGELAESSDIDNMADSDTVE